MRTCCNTSEMRAHAAGCLEKNDGIGRIEIEWPVPKEGYSMRRALEGSFPSFIKENINLYKTKEEKKTKKVLSSDLSIKVVEVIDEEEI